MACEPKSFPPFTLRQSHQQQTSPCPPLAALRALCPLPGRRAQLAVGTLKGNLLIYNKRTLKKARRRDPARQPRGPPRRAAQARPANQTAYGSRPAPKPSHHSAPAQKQMNCYYFGKSAGAGDGQARQAHLRRRVERR